MGDLEIGKQILPRCKDALRQPRQKHSWGAKAAKLVGLEVAFRFPERIEHSNQSRSLPGEIMQIEQDESPKLRSAELSLDLMAVAQNLQFAGGAEEITRLIPHAISCEGLPENFEVLRAQQAGVFRNLVEVGIHAPLPDLMTHHRHRKLLDPIPVIKIRGGRLGVEFAVHSLPPAMLLRTGWVLKLVLREVRIIGGTGVEVASIPQRLAPQNPFAQILDMTLARRLVAMRQQDKGRVVAVAFEQTLGLLIQPGIDQAAVANDGSLVGPDATLDLQIHPHLIRHFKGSLRRAPGVETHMVQPVLTDNPENAPPSLDIHRRIPGERKIPRILRPSQEDRAVVHDKLRALGDKVPPPESADCLIAAG